MTRFKRFRLICTWVALVGVLLEIFCFTPPWGRFTAEYFPETLTLVVSGWFKQSYLPVRSSCGEWTHINWIHIMVGRNGWYQSLGSEWFEPFPPIRRYRRTFFLSGERIDSVAVTLHGGSKWCTTPVSDWEIPVP